MRDGRRKIAHVENSLYTKSETSRVPRDPRIVISKGSRGTPCTGESNGAEEIMFHCRSVVCSGTFLPRPLFPGTVLPPP